MLKDPCAIMYGTMDRIGDDLYLVSNKTLGQTTLSVRKSKEKHNAKIVKYTFNDGSSRYSIKRLGERLAYLDINKPDEDNDIYIKYITNVIGREKYRSLEQILLQSAVEDSLNNGIVPSFTAVPAEIGDLNFDRSRLYSFMGAEVIELPLVKNGEVQRLENGDVVTFKLVEYSKDKVLERLKQINEKDAFIFPKTKISYENLSFGEN